MPTDARMLHTNDFPIVAAGVEFAQLPASGLEPLQSRSRMKPTTTEALGIRLLELSAAYREAHATHAAALTAALQGQCRPLVSAATWKHLEDERKAAGEDMEAAKSALLLAALDIT